MPEKTQGYLYLSLAMVLVGSTVIAGKLISSELPPFTATALRLAIALPFFAGLMRWTGAPWPRLTVQAWLLLLVQAVSGSVGYTTLLISGLRFTQAADAGVVIGTLPVMSAGIAILLLGERPRRSLLLALVLATAGVAAVTYAPGVGGARSLFGDALILAAVACEGLFILLNKRLPTAIPPLVLSTLMTGLGLAVAIIPAILEAPWRGAITTSAAAAVVYYALVPTVGGYLLWYAGAARASGAEASLFTALAPVSAVLLAAAVLGERVGLNQVIGIACVLVAVVSLSLAHLEMPRLLAAAGSDFDTH
jgi:drug/metabolite transporter (DMT)-like permease